MARTIIGIGGGSASGKSTLVEQLSRRLGDTRVAVMAYDRYYRDRSALAPDIRANVNFDHPDALETDLLLSHLASLKAGLPVEAPIYDFVRHVRTDRVDRVEPRPIIVVEGVLVLADARLRALMDLRVFVDTEERVRFSRRLERDMAERGRTLESVRAQFDATVQPMHLAFVEPSRHHADVVIRDGGLNDEAVERVAREIQRRFDAWG
jgi:uridine kinase